MTEPEYIYATDLARVRCILKLLGELNHPEVDECLLHGNTVVARLILQWEVALEKRVQIDD